jgi:hypothetical protein
MEDLQQAPASRPATQSARRILHFSLAPSFDRKFLFHPALNEPAGGVHYFAIGQSGYSTDRKRTRVVLCTYLRALRLLAAGFGDRNTRTIAYCHTTKFALPGLLLCRLFGVGQVVYFNHGVPYIGHRGPMRWVLRLLERANVAVAHRFVTVSPAMVGFLQPSAAANPWRHSPGCGSEAAPAARAARVTCTRVGCRPAKACSYCSKLGAHT